MKKPTIFLVDSDLIDLNLLIVKIERKFNCTLYTFFDLEEILLYVDMVPEIFIIDEHTYHKKRAVLENIIRNMNQKSDTAQTKFVVYSEKGLVDIHHQRKHSDNDIEIIPLDTGFNSIPISLNRIIG